MPLTVIGKMEISRMGHNQLIGTFVKRRHWDRQAGVDREGSIHSPGRAPQGADPSLMPPRRFHIEGLDSRLAKTGGGGDEGFAQQPSSCDLANKFT